MKGHIRERGLGRWAIVLDIRNPETGKRRRKWHAFKGTKREAQTECAKLISAMGQGTYIEASKVTVAEFLCERLEVWEATRDISPRTAQRYRQLIENQIIPHLGSKVLQKIKPLDLEKWHLVLRKAKCGGAAVSRRAQSAMRTECWAKL